MGLFTKDRGFLDTANLLEQSRMFENSAKNLHAENQRLKAEIEQLKRDPESALALVTQGLEETVRPMQEEIGKLKSEVESQATNITELLEIFRDFVSKIEPVPTKGRR